MAWDVEAEVWQHGAGLSSRDRFVLLALAQHAKDERRCWPSQERLAARTSLSEKTVQRAMDSLEEQGCITIGPLTGRARTVIIRPSTSWPGGQVDRSEWSESPLASGQVDRSEWSESPGCPVRVTSESVSNPSTNPSDEQIIEQALATFGVEPEEIPVRYKYDDGPDKSNPFGKERPAPRSGNGFLIDRFQAGLNRAQSNGYRVTEGAEAPILRTCFTRLRGGGYSNDEILQLMDCYLDDPDSWNPETTPSRDFSAATTTRRLAMRVLAGNTDQKGSVAPVADEDDGPAIERAKEMTWRD